MLPKKSAGKQNVCIVLIDVDKYLGNSQQALPAKNYPMLPKKSTGNYPPMLYSDFCNNWLKAMGYPPWVQCNFGYYCSVGAF